MTDPNFFQEIQEDLERQKLQALWKKYGFWIILTAVGIVLSTASSTAYSAWKARHQQAVTMAHLSAERSASGKSLDVLQSFAAQNKGESQSSMALLRAGSLALNQGDQAKAISFFEEVAGDAKIDPAFRQLGALLSVQAQLDSGDPAKLSERLNSLVEKDAPWRFSARETQGYLALRAGDKAKAEKIFADLSQDAQAPQSLAARASDVLRTLN